MSCTFTAISKDTDQFFAVVLQEGLLARLQLNNDVCPLKCIAAMSAAIFHTLDDQPIIWSVDYYTRWLLAWHAYCYVFSHLRLKPLS